MAEEVQDFKTLLKQFFVKMPRIGDLIEGEVLSIDSGATRIDINGMTTGVVRGPELFAESNEYANIKVGDKIQATVIDGENENGEIELSFRIAGNQRVWERMQKYVDEGIAVDGKIIAANKGGLMVKVDALVAFMPVSQLSPENYPRIPGGDKNRILEHLQGLVGKSFQIKVLDANQEDEKLIVSEKAVWEDDQKAVLDSYKIGDVIEGEVSALTSFGAFVKFGEGLEGLVHISEIAWQRIDHPKDVLKIGDNVKAQIIDLNKSKIYLSVKRLVDDPWKRVKDTYKIGQIVTGKIHKVEPFGLMVKLDDEIHGLAHISEVSDKQIADVKELREKFTIGQDQEFEIISIEPAEHRLGLKVKGVKGKTAKKAEDKKEETKEEASKEEVREDVPAEAPAEEKVEEKEEAPVEEKKEEVKEEKEA